MFGKVGEAIGSGAQSVIQEGVSIVGKVQAEGEIRIDGVLEGALVSKARVTVGPKGMVRADIEGIEIVVQGKVSGNLVAKRIELRKGARVEGDLSTQALVIEDGVYFQGMSQMQPDQVTADVPSSHLREVAQEGGARVAVGGDFFEGTSDDQ